MNYPTVYKTNQTIEWNEDKCILIETGNENIIQSARKNPEAYATYKALLAHDYVHYFHDKGISKFYKREQVGELFKRKDLIHHQGIFYTLTPPTNRKVNSLIAKKLLVIFDCMPAMDKYDSCLMPLRMFPNFFTGIERNLVKNVTIMRIMDLNVSHGSHYVNTVNYPTYETEIQEAILKVMTELHIGKEQVVLYGASKGGTGAVLHGSALDMNFLAVDPILDVAEYNDEYKDFHFLKGLRKENITEEVNAYLQHTTNFNKYIIGSHQVAFNFEQICKLNQEKVQVLDMHDPMITSHPEVSRNTVPEQLMLLNRMLTV